MTGEIHARMYVLTFLQQISQPQQTLIQILLRRRLLHTLQKPRLRMLQTNQPPSATSQSLQQFVTYLIRRRLHPKTKPINNPPISKKQGEKTLTVRPINPLPFTTAYTSPLPALIICFLLTICAATIANVVLTAPMPHVKTSEEMVGSVDLITRR